MLRGGRCGYLTHDIGMPHREIRAEGWDGVWKVPGDDQRPSRLVAVVHSVRRNRSKEVLVLCELVT
jgi:hypothetical protein